MAEVIKMPGTVRSVNGIKPDENANVELEVKPLFLIKQFRYKLTTEDQSQWKNNYIGNWTLKKSIADWGLPENFPRNIPGYHYKGVIMGNPFSTGSEQRPTGCHFETNNYLVIEVGNKFSHSAPTSSSDSGPVIGTILELLFLYVKEDYDFSF